MPRHVDGSFKRSTISGLISLPLFLALGLGVGFHRSHFHLVFHLLFLHLSLGLALLGHSNGDHDGWHFAFLTVLH